MANMTKKTTILFSPKMYAQLERLAKKEKTSVAGLLRQAVIRQYLLPQADREARIEAAAAIAAMQLPVADWPTMEREIGEGRLGSCPPA